MPIYAYKCESCGHAKDVLQKMSDPLLTDCPACGLATFKKQVTSAGFQLKGSGWYATDFKGGAAPAATPNDKSESKAGAGSDAAPSSGASASSESKSDAKSEAKSAAKSDAKPASTPSAGASSASPASASGG